MKKAILILSVLSIVFFVGCTNNDKKSQSDSFSTDEITSVEYFESNEESIISIVEESSSEEESTSIESSSSKTSQSSESSVNEYDDGISDWSPWHT